jgi:YfiH family protein
MVKTKKLGAEALQVEAGGISYITFPRFADSKTLTHAVSTRTGGVSRENRRSLNLSHKVQDDAVRVSENRSLLTTAMGFEIDRAAYLEQVHSDIVLRLDAVNQLKSGEPLGKGDGIITNLAHVPLVILVADCLPVFFFDPLHRAIGLAHAGWRGTASHVAPKTLLAMGESYGTRPEEVRVAMGPSIGACCYEVGEDVHKEFLEIFPWGEEVFQRSALTQWKLNLEEANARQLLEIGIKEENLIRSGLCTVRHNDLFYSHRAEAQEGEPTGRFGSFIMLNS